MSAILLMVSATTLVAQPESAPQADPDPVVVLNEIVPAEGRLLAEDGRTFHVTDRTVLEMGPNTLQGPEVFEVLQPGMALRIVPEPDSDPPRIERMRVETR